MNGDGKSPKYVLVSDLDGTLLGDSGALSRFRAFCDAHAELLGLIYASGRFCSSIQESISGTLLPEPLATIGGVGSEIWQYPEQQPWQAWWDKIATGWSHDAVRRTLVGETGLELQPDDDQSPFKVSYYYRDATEADLARLRKRLMAADLAVSLIYSSGRDLDILPRGVNKGTAAAYLTSSLGYGSKEVLGAGNSLNDADLMAHEFFGIIVGNAHDDLKVLADRDRVYLAKATYADGVLEGIGHWTGVKT